MCVCVSVCVSLALSEGQGFVDEKPNATLFFSGEQGSRNSAVQWCSRLAEAGTV